MEAVLLRVHRHDLRGKVRLDEQQRVVVKTVRTTEAIFWGVSVPLCFHSSLALYSFRVHHPFNQDDWPFLAHAMASD
jgi:hypothetical protein